MKTLDALIIYCIFLGIGIATLFHLAMGSIALPAGFQAVFIIINMIYIVFCGAWVNNIRKRMED